MYDISEQISLVERNYLQFYDSKLFHFYSKLELKALLKANDLLSQTHFKDSLIIVPYLN